MNKTQKNIGEIIEVLESIERTLSLHQLAIKMLKSDIDDLKGFEKAEDKTVFQSNQPLYTDKSMLHDISDIEYAELAEKDKRDFYETSRGV